LIIPLFQVILLHIDPDDYSAYRYQVIVNRLQNIYQKNVSDHSIKKGEDSARELLRLRYGQDQAGQTVL
jgi:hypothetical protein